jgi:hypothetical protein
MVAVLNLFSFRRRMRVAFLAPCRETRLGSKKLIKLVGRIKSAIERAAI